MAGQPDINAILAALAAQGRVGGTPSQSTPAPPTLPPGYPGAVPQQSATPSLGGFALPQPTSSGSVDLSSVRPVSTGSVSIAEAIAKARSIAADKNISSSRDDPRASGRSYRRSRSRSRSPQRRDGGRDSFNPYRDERRGDDRRGGYNRDRSRSPGRGGQGGQPSYSPREDKDSETITVKSALVGLIIGRAGENLRRVEAETGARVQFVPAREPGAQRQCTITGTLRQREAAKREIFSTIEENGGGGGAAFDTRGSSARVSQPPPNRAGSSGASAIVPEGETNRQVLVPDKTVGLIIGRGGETIRDIQDRSGCHINIVGENKSISGRRPVNLIGSLEAADKAEALIWEIVDSDTRGGQEVSNGGRRPQDTPAYAQPPPAAAGRGYEDDGKLTESIMVPSEAVGMIIGKGGESIKEMQNQTGCKINVNQPSNPDVQRKIDLVGSRTAVEGAKRVIWEKVDTVQQRDRASGRGGGRGGDRDNFPQQQQRPDSYGQPSQAAAQMPAVAAPGGAGSDPNAPDPYAQYGGYQNYVALWYAAMQQQQQQGGQPPQGQ